MSQHISESEIFITLQGLFFKNLLFQFHINISVQIKSLLQKGISQWAYLTMLWFTSQSGFKTSVKIKFCSILSLTTPQNHFVVSSVSCLTLILLWFVSFTGSKRIAVIETQYCPTNIHSRGSRTTSNSRKLHNSNSSGDPFFTRVISKDTKLNCHFKKNDLHFKAISFFHYNLLFLIY